MTASCDFKESQSFVCAFLCKFHSQDREDEKKRSEKNFFMSVHASHVSIHKKTCLEQTHSAAHNFHWDPSECADKNEKRKHTKIYCFFFIAVVLIAVLHYSLSVSFHTSNCWWKFSLEMLRKTFFLLFFYFFRKHIDGETSKMTSWTVLGKIIFWKLIKNNKSLLKNFKKEISIPWERRTNL